MKNNLKKTLTIVQFFLAVFLVFIALETYDESNVNELPGTKDVNAPASSFEGVSYMEEAWKVIEDRYFEDLNEEKKREITENAISGMMSSFDRYSRFVPPTKSKIEWENTEGEFGGIGVTIAPYGKFLQVVSVVKGGPAYKSEIKNGDIIISADGNSFEDSSYEESVSYVRGPIGKAVQLEIIDSTTAETINVSVVREIVVVPSIGKVEKINDKTYFIELLQFNKNTPSLLKQELISVIDKGAESLILDLRGNPGGELYSCLEIVDLFLDKGLIVSIKFKNDERSFSAKSGGVGEDLNLIVLVDEYSASASEIFAGAVQDHKRGLIVGNRTFGKGLVQHGENLDSGGSVIITTAVYLTPNGHQVNGNGINPDFEISSSDDEKVIQILAEIENLQVQISALRTDIRDRIGDLMLEKAIEEIEK